MTALNKQALRQKAVKAGGGEWQSRKEPGIGGEYTVIVKGSLVKHQGWSTCRPVADEIVDKKTMDFIAAANPATVLALLDELEAAGKHNDELAIYSKTTLEFREAALNENRHLKLELEIAEKRIAELEARTVTLTADRSAESEVSGYDSAEFYSAGWNARGKADRDAIRAAGIGVKGE